MAAEDGQQQQRASEWSFSEPLSLDDVELRQRQVLEDGEVYNVSYAHSIQGRETAKITYKELRKVCSHLGVRYYKNKPKDLMMELIAQKKLKGQVPESYRFLKITRERKSDNRERVVLYNDDVENRDPMENRSLFDNQVQDEDHEMSEAHQLFISPKRQRTATDPITITSSSATNTFLQPVSPAASESDHRSSSPGYGSGSGSGIPSTPASVTDRNQREMSLKDRSDTFTLLRHVRQQILDVEEEIAAHTESGIVQLSNIKTQRLAEDLEFYLSERHALMQKLASSKREFSKLELELVQTANAALKFLKVLKSGLGKYDRRRGQFFLNTSKRFIKYEIQDVKKNASDLRYLATRIRRTNQPSRSEVNAAQMCMNQTAEAMIDLIRAARVYDHNYASTTTPVDDDMKMETKLFGRAHHYENSKSMEDLFRSSSSEFKVRVTGESFKTPNTVEAVVRLTLRSSFSGLNALRSQIATTEKALAASSA